MQNRYWLTYALLLWLWYPNLAFGRMAECLGPTKMYTMNSASMLPDFRNGEIVSAQCWPHAMVGGDEGLARLQIDSLRPRLSIGDIVVFRFSDTTVYVKRVVGLPGDHVQMTKGQLYLNGEKVPREPLGAYLTDGGGPHMPLKLYIEHLPNGASERILKASDDGPLNNTQEFVVPSESVFVLGDNRDNSFDSRINKDNSSDSRINVVGYIPVDKLIGIVREKLPKP